MRVLRGMRPDNAAALAAAAEELARVTQRIHAYPEKILSPAYPQTSLFSCVTGCAGMSSIEKYLQKTLALFFQLYKTTLPCVHTMTS